MGGQQNGDVSLERANGSKGSRRRDRVAVGRCHSGSRRRQGKERRQVAQAQGGGRPTVIVMEHVQIASAGERGGLCGSQGLIGGQGRQNSVSSLFGGG